MPSIAHGFIATLAVCSSAASQTEPLTTPVSAISRPRAGAHPSALPVGPQLSPGARPEKGESYPSLASALAASEEAAGPDAQEVGPGAQQAQSTSTEDGAEPAGIPPQDLREKAAVLTGVDLVRDDFPGSWPMFGDNMRMKIGGYVKADVIYDFDGTTDPFQFLMSTIPVEGSPEYGDEGYLSFNARESRFNIDVRRIEEGERPLRAYIEGDFWNDDNQFRLRQAYIVAGDLLIGQTWTTLSALESLPNLLDFASGDALFGGRTTQIRYQRRLDDAWKLAVGLENLSFPGIENPNALDGDPSQALPLVAVRADRQWDSGLLTLGASVAQLRWDGGSTGPDAEALQWNVLLAGRQYMGTEDYVTWNFSYGDGAGENIMAFAGSQANAVLNSAGDLDTMQSYSAVLGYMHRWRPGLESNFSYAYGWLDAPPERAPLALKRGGIAHANIVWFPTKHLSYGLEYMYGEQRTTDDSYGNASRIQFSAKFEF